MGGLEVLVLSLVFVICNGLFVAAEFALIATPRATLEHRASGGDRSARRILTVLESPIRQDRYIATAQLGITISSLGLGMFGEHALADRLEPYFGEIPFIGAAALAGLISLAALTVVHIVIGEMVPKGIALQRPGIVARVTNWPMWLLQIALYPFVWLLPTIAHQILRLVGIRRQENQSDLSYSPEELALIVEESERGGVVRAESGRILRELFEFDELAAREAMVPRVRAVGLPVGATPDQIRKVVASHRHTRYPVYDGDLDHIVGMLHVKDLLRHLLRNESITADGVRRIPVVPETTVLDDVLSVMQRARAHMAVVIDEHGGTAGLITLEDLFEEVVGELDEGVPSAPELASYGRDVARARGTVRLDELGQHFDLEIEHPEVDSVSGLVLALLGRPPVVGDTVEYERLRLEVLSTKGRGVGEVRAEVLPPPDDQRVD